MEIIIFWGIIILLFIIGGVKYERNRKENFLVIKLITKIQYELKTYNKRDIVKLVCNEIIDNHMLPYTPTNKLPNDEKFYDIVYSSIQEIDRKTRGGLRKYYYGKDFQERVQSLNFSVINHSNHLFENKGTEKK